MNSDLYISKSFCCVGKSQHSCFGCSYCRVVTNGEVNYMTIPSIVNPILSKIPVAVNLFYGDPLLQYESTLKILKSLEDFKHTGPVIVITKGNLKKFPIPDFNLDMHLAFSTFGIKHRYDKLSRSYIQFAKNLETSKKAKYHRSIEFRPVCHGINDSRNTIEKIFKIAKYYSVPIGYSGLQGTPPLVQYWEKNNMNFKPYPGFTFGHKKSISKKVQDIFDELSLKYSVPIFRKTSCLISYVHNLDRDYNAHYYRPSEMNCQGCVMKTKCFDFKSKLDTDKTKLQHLVPFDFTIKHKEKHECILKKKNICEFPTADCSNINGNIIEISKKLTTSDVRVIKWLTGYTVDADFEESSFLSDEWRNQIS